jgi:DNA replication initiation complex subunit (GINS family)
MISYSDLYELLRKEKYTEILQPLPKNFLTEFSEYLNDKKFQSSQEDDLFADSIAKSKKQLENSISIFKELARLRKKKILNLAFIATETGMMKRDYENMLTFEKETFDKLVKSLEENDKELTKSMNTKKEDEKSVNKLILFSQNVEQFIDLNGNAFGPFTAGQIANLDLEVSNILVASGKARLVDED